MARRMLRPSSEPVSARLIQIPSLEERRRTALSWPAGLAILLVVAALLFWWGWTNGSDARVLARMPAAERRALFQLTRSKAEALCAAADLEEQCRAEVELLSKFPECGVDCQAFVINHRPRASR